MPNLDSTVGFLLIFPILPGVSFLLWVLYRLNREFRRMRRRPNPTQPASGFKIRVAVRPEPLTRVSRR